MEEIINRLSYAAATYSFEGRNYPNCIVFREDLENLINKYKEQEKIIELMAYRLNEFANLGVLIDCPAEYDGVKDLRNCPRDKNCVKCIIDYFKKKVRDENE